MIPAHLQALHAHQSRFCLRVGAEGRGSQIENHETHTETVQILDIMKIIVTYL